METDMTSRRHFLASTLVAAALPRLAWSEIGAPAFLAAAREPDGSFSLYGLSLAGEARFRLPLPARGHAGAAHPNRAEAIIFARRPGTFALVLNCANGALVNQLAPPPGRQFNGHGIYTPNGDFLLTSEQDSETSAGLIGIWDAQKNYARIGDFSTQGLGPHDIRLLDQGRTIVVANGGIATDAADRRKLNIPTMRPNLAYLTLGGEPLEIMELEPDLRQSSIRHLAITGDGLVGFAMQWEGPENAATPLLGLHRKGQSPTLCEAPLTDELLMKGYAGSIAFSGSETEVAITSPKGGRIHRFSRGGAFLGAIVQKDVCGLAPGKSGYFSSDGFGGLIVATERGPTKIAEHPCAWDNHILAL
jgi:hypothetical protein